MPVGTRRYAVLRPFTRAERLWNVTSLLLGTVYSAGFLYITLVAAGRMIRHAFTG